MKDKFYLLLRAISVSVMGVLLIAYKEQWAGALVVGVGVVFALFGLSSVISWLIKKNLDRNPGFFPVLGVAGVVLGVMLIVAPETFVNAFVYIAGALLVFFALIELFSLVSMRNDVKLPGWFFVTPVVALLLGGFALWNPTEAAALPFLLISIGCIVCGLGWIIATIVWMIRSRKTSRANESSV